MTRRYMRHDSHVVKREPGEMKVALEILRGRAVRKLRPVEGPAFLIGSASDCDLVLGDTRFPEVHSYLRLSDENVTIRHLGFSPDLLVNGKPATHTSLREGDVIQMGPYHFGVHIGLLTESDEQRRREKEKAEPARPSYLSIDGMGVSKSRSLLSDIRTALDAQPPHLRVFGPVQVATPTSPHDEKSSTTMLLPKRRASGR